ncbi:hypothetical protein RB595_000132 [Gaeumannomyces hyphopodioides]
MDRRATASFHATHSGEATESHATYQAPVPNAQSQHSQNLVRQHDAPFDLLVPGQAQEPQFDGGQPSYLPHHHTAPPLPQQPFPQPDSLQADQSQPIPAHQLPPPTLRQYAPWLSYPLAEAARLPGTPASVREDLMLSMLRDLHRDIASLRDDIYNLRIENHERLSRLESYFRVFF